MASKKSAGPELEYAGTSKIQVAFTKKGESLEVSRVTGYDDVPGPLRNLPFWLPPEKRRVGQVIYDDGEGFKHDKGKLAYKLGAKEAWKGFDTLLTSYRYQGMQQHDNWAIAARYDQASGYLLWAEMRVRLIEDRVQFEMTLSTPKDKL